MVKIGIIKEGKIPADKRVPLGPEQCEEILNNFPNVEIYVQSSPIRKFTDNEYKEKGIAVVEEVDHCDILLGVKEVPIDQLIPNKTYFFFSHTIKKQSYNRKLLRAILDKNIRLIDWEVITNAQGQRLVAFGRYAGIVGCYNTFLGYGKKTDSYELKPAHLCFDREEMEEELSKIVLPNSTKIVLTGHGRVGGGAVEILKRIGIREVSADVFKKETFDEPVYTQLCVEEYNAKRDGSSFTKFDFYEDPTDFISKFSEFSSVADIYIACHFWDNRAPYIFTRADAKSKNWKIKMVGDISCDIDCAVASTLQPSSISDPFYGYNPISEEITSFKSENAIGVMAVDNLPCELPKDASVDFGKDFIKHVLPGLVGEDPEEIISRATMTFGGKLTNKFQYLQNYVDAVNA